MTGFHIISEDIIKIQVVRFVLSIHFVTKLVYVFQNPVVHFFSFGVMVVDLMTLIILVFQPLPVFQNFSRKYQKLPYINNFSVLVFQKTICTILI